ncbi:hypothetical protein [Shewanella xiamenensis]|uniref:Uncharacterized protein n=1 Tax=Shewanella xiamenensis TaxID=332186 RepID=A0ABT6UFT0_9GAMM|nr:hypothetical protein [Shewanella xiamenensis]MDI5833266.1 hypothetical protein [Shewanella xiamenensis]
MIQNVFIIETFFYAYCWIFFALAISSLLYLDLFKSIEVNEKIIVISVFFVFFMAVLLWVSFTNNTTGIHRLYSFIIGSCLGFFAGFVAIRICSRLYKRRLKTNAFFIASSLFTFVYLFLLINLIPTYIMSLCSYDFPYVVNTPQESFFIENYIDKDGEVKEVPPPCRRLGVGTTLHLLEGEDIIQIDVGHIGDQLCPKRLFLLRNHSHTKDEFYMTLAMPNFNMKEKGN